MRPDTVHQNIMSTVPLVKNGKSNSDRTRHVAIRFFFFQIEWQALKLIKNRALR